MTRAIFGWATRRNEQTDWHPRCQSCNGFVDLRDRFPPIAYSKYSLEIGRLTDGFDRTVGQIWSRWHLRVASGKGGGVSVPAATSEEPLGHVRGWKTGVGTNRDALAVGPDRGRKRRSGENRQPPA